MFYYMSMPHHKKGQNAMEDAYVLQLSDHKFQELYLCFCGYAKCEPLHSFGPAVRPNYILHYILKGKGRYYVEDNHYELQAGQGFLIEPEVQTFYQADQEEPWTYLWVGFGGGRAKEYLKDIGLNSHQLIFRSSHADELKRLVITMLKNNTSSTANQFLLESLLYSFFSILSQDIDIAPSAVANEENTYIRRALEYIHNNYSNNIKVKECGVELFVLDDGWFGERSSDHAGLGDWTANPAWLSNGITGLAARIEDLGMKFGLWFEPEMVNKDSDLYRAHPVWQNR